MPDPNVVISFKDLKQSEKVREAVDKRCTLLAEEFPETTRFEVTLSPDGGEYTAHGHVTGRDIEVASHAEGQQMGEAADRLLDKLERSLRKVHDKKIFKNRRDARKADLKRSSA